MQDKPRTILGLDLSCTETGWAVAIANTNKTQNLLYSSIKTNKKDFADDIDRFLHINAEIVTVMARYNPDVVFIEDTFVGGNNQTAKKLMQLGGIVRAFLRSIDVPFMDVPPTTLKKFICGKGNASKELVINTVNKVLKTEIKNDNIADSISLALFGCHQYALAKQTMEKIWEDE